MTKSRARNKTGLRAVKRILDNCHSFCGLAAFSGDYIYNLFIILTRYRINIIYLSLCLSKAIHLLSVTRRSVFLFESWKWPLSDYIRAHWFAYIRIFVCNTIMNYILCVWSDLDQPSCCIIREDNSWISAHNMVKCVLRNNHIRRTRFIIIISWCNENIVISCIMFDYFWR